MVSFNIDVRRSSASSLMSVLLTMSLILLDLLREMHMWGWILGTDCRRIKQLLSLFRLGFKISRLDQCTLKLDANIARIESYILMQPLILF